MFSDSSYSYRKPKYRNIKISKQSPRHYNSQYQSAQHQNPPISVSLTSEYSYIFKLFFQHGLLESLKVPLPREAGTFVLEGDEEVDLDDENQEMQIESDCSGGQCDDEIQRTHLLDYKVNTNSISKSN